MRKRICTLPSSLPVTVGGCRKKLIHLKNPSLFRAPQVLSLALFLPICMTISSIIRK